MSALGFENMPKGKPLARFVDLDDDLGAAYERCIGYEKDFHVHDRLNLTFPRGASVIRFTTRDPDDKFVVDESQLLWMPARVSHRQDAVSAIYDNLALFPALGEVERSVGAIALPARTIRAKRTRLLDELIHRYFYERILHRRDVPELARQIIAETVRVLTKTKCMEPPSSLDTDDTVVGQALRYVEANLFGELTTSAVAGFARTSPATLFRHFRKVTGMTPLEYARRRRLDEARHLLRTGDYRVGDVALLVGYDDLPAFSKAFKKQFRVPPSLARAEA